MTIDILTIRDAGLADIPFIYDCVMQLSIHVEARAKFKGTIGSFTRSLGFGAPAEKRATALVGLENGNSVAVAIFFPHFNAWEPSPGVLLDTLYVRPEMRGKGYGRAMIAAVIAKCKEEGGSYIEWTCHENNDMARKMYDCIGARKVEGLECFRLYNAKFEGGCSIAV
eukprot:Gregarina_sp_Pseudo_9__203@NODE_1132_length_1853_cov_47_036384_g1059_i0_p2_GENE_NODE_1132_length_1853_cov_47_036384_g1059_i0NODE_1132_length_1853_cov_47_036384_g1059_i0_p2_ORF_typecomplete_len168_score20_86Acetyltransf_1/PF00583_25/1_9e16Acetyltransf_10/PF13673_7/1_3e13FR47/PF08445_10/1_3e03FR47/PF08445_10/1e10Acetyltransf_9/PF13527_7/2_3e08Acetyltransf_7/PF13508_7/3e08GNAT_acetyltran/PF12746_7/6_1e08Acetyltransf_4/PF13420_7/1_4e06Acetyltransf_3/PF13302_7/7_5e03Acetyltransf_3/PF13302_7/6_7e06Ace